MIDSTDKFFTEYYELKKSEQWNEIIVLGELALKSQTLNTEEKSKIILRLASCYFYKGDIEKCAELSDSSSKDIEIAKYPNLLARSYYLASAAYRALSSRASNKEDKLKFATTASKYINDALLIDEKSITPFIKAKIYFNAGALEHEVNLDLDKALKYYQVAIEIFDQNKAYEDDYNRTVIRIIRAKLELGNIKVAELEAKNLDGKIAPESKTKVHLLQLKSKIAFKNSELFKSYCYALNACKLAVDKCMIADYTRSNSMIQNIIKQDPNVLLHNHNEVLKILENEEKGNSYVQNFG